MPSPAGHPTAQPVDQRGAALLALVLVVTIAVLSLFVAGLMADNPRREAEKRAQLRLADARAALIAHAVRDWCQSPGPSDQPPDRLPCPALPSADGVAAASCATAPNRLPWRTLGTGPLRDYEGECFWYVRDAASTTTVATLYAPGPALGGQTRGGGTGSECGTEPNANNYIEGSNDTVLSIDRAELDFAKTKCPAAAGPCNIDGNALANYENGSSNDCRVPPGNSVDPNCQTLVDQISGSTGNSCSSSCISAANSFINPPCIANLNSPQCQAALAALRACSP